MPDLRAGSYDVKVVDSAAAALATDILRTARQICPRGGPRWLAAGTLPRSAKRTE